jgi:hypothetical protein
MPASLAIIIKSHTVLIVVSARFGPGTVIVRAIASANKIAGDATDDRACDCPPCTSARGSISHHTTANGTDRRSGIATALAICGFCGCGRNGERESTQSQYHCASIRHLRHSLEFAPVD